MLFHVYDWIGDIRNVLMLDNYTVHTSGLYCVEASESSPAVIFSKEELLEMDEHENVRQLIALCSAIGLLTCICGVMVYKVASHSRYYAVFQPKQEGIPPEYSERDVEA